MHRKTGIVITGSLIGILAPLLVYYGNPGNMGICIACFIRDTAGALGLHRAPVVQFIRPEIIGIVLGAFLVALGKREFQVRGGSAPFIRFVLGFIVMIGALMFLGCPLRMILRLGGGDLNALVGLVGFVSGILLGTAFLNKGFSLRRSYTLNALEGYLYPAINVGFLVLLITGPAFIFFSKEGPGSMYAPILLTLAVGLLIGAMAQRTRLCMVGGVRDLVMFKDSYLILGFLAIFIFATLTNVFSGFYHVGFIQQPIAHADGLWNFLGMVLAGWGSVLLGGCPLRQLILSAEGNIDSVMAVLGMFSGAAFCHNFTWASSSAGPTFNGKIAVIIGLITAVIISSLNIDKNFLVCTKGGLDEHVG